MLVPPLIRVIYYPLSELKVAMTVKLPLLWTGHPFLFNQIEIEQTSHIDLIKTLDVPYVFLSQAASC